MSAEMILLTGFVAVAFAAAWFVDSGGKYDGLFKNQSGTG